MLSLLSSDHVLWLVVISRWMGSPYPQGPVAWSGPGAARPG